METKKLGRPKKLGKVKLVSFGLDPLDFARLKKMAKKLDLTVPDLIRKMHNKKCFNRVIRLAMEADVEKDGE